MGKFIFGNQREKVSSSGIPKEQVLPSWKATWELFPLWKKPQTEEISCLYGKVQDGY